MGVAFETGCDRVTSTALRVPPNTSMCDLHPWLIQLVPVDLSMAYRVDCEPNQAHDHATFLRTGASGWLHSRYQATGAKHKQFRCQLLEGLTFLT